MNMDIGDNKKLCGELLMIEICQKKTKSVMQQQPKWTIHRIMTIAWETFNNIKTGSTYTNYI